ncbi:MAG: SAM-dependent methyltransferase [Acidimicrobiia bacterium]
MGNFPDVALESLLMIDERLTSCVCTQAQLESEVFRKWITRIREPFKLYRKLWEFAYIAQALHERGMLEPGKRGLGFAVGREPLPALFASYGCEIVATDMEEVEARDQGWVETGQHAASLHDLNEQGICDPDVFRRQVTFRCVDMNRIPHDLRGFDFCWSSCAFEHLGSLARGRRFLYNMTRCLGPGGVAVHTTEYNVTSNDHTIDHNPWCVLFRKRYIEEIARGLTARAHRIDVDFRLGDGEADQYVDLEPFTNKNPYTHLKLKIDDYVSTSIGLIVEVGSPPLRYRVLDWSVERLRAARRQARTVYSLVMPGASRQPG